ncbi:hypothetical protein ACT3OH_15475 [Vreelandella zhanjiangensis]|uniref:hypothetical protein n=1 Tax=Vreelandella zhanjiangensis TaxID=1121960 RepID=UPI00402A9F61
MFENTIDIASNENYQITLHTSSSDKCLITFGGMPTCKSRTGFGTGFCAKYGYDNIYVSQLKGTQYQGLSLAKFSEMISPFLSGYKDVYTYGASLGGYCALYYGGYIGSKIISAAPKNSAHPSLAKLNIKWNHNVSLSQCKSNYPPLIIYDPYREEESDYIERYVATTYSNVNRIKLPFAGHKVLNSMRDSGVLVSFLKKYIDNGEIVNVKIDEFSTSYLCQEGRLYFKSKKYELAINKLRESMSLEFNSEAANYLLRCYICLCDKISILDLFKKTISECGDLRVYPRSLTERAFKIIQ